MKIISIIITCLMTVIINMAYATPPAFEANYVIKKSRVSLGTMKTQLSYQGKQYQYFRQTKAKGLANLFSGDVITEDSKGFIQSDLFYTKRFSFRHKSRKKNKSEQWQFTSPNTIQGNLNGIAYQLIADKNTSDTAILDLKLMQSMAKGSKKLSYRLIDKGAVKTYHFQRLGKVNINVPAGQYEAEKIRVVRKGGKRKTTLWLAKSLNYLPIQIEHNDNGSIFTSQLTSYR